MAPKTESPNIGLGQQFTNLFNNEAYLRLREHRKLLNRENQTAQDLEQVKLDWAAAKANFGPFIGIAQVLLAFQRG